MQGNQTLNPTPDRLHAFRSRLLHTNLMQSSRSGLLPKKPKEFLPLPPRQRLQQRPHQSLDLGLTVFLASRLAHRVGLKRATGGR